MAFPVEGSQYANRIYRDGVYRYTSELAVGELTVTGNHTLGVEKTVNVDVGAATITVPALELGEMKVIRKISATAGTITITLPSGHTFPDGSSSITLTNQYDEVTIERVSATGWVYAYTKVVRAEYRKSLSAPLNGIVDFEVKVEDTNNAVVTGSNWKFPAPIQGVYSITASILGEIGNYPQGQHLYMFAQKNNSQVSMLTYNQGAAYTGYSYAQGTISLRLEKNDYINILAYSNGSNTNNNPDPNYCYVMIDRIGD